MKSKSEIKQFDIKQFEVTIKGIAPLVVHRFSEKAKKQIEDKQQGVAKSRKYEQRNPAQEVEDAKHISPLGFEGFPAAGFKAAMIRGAKMIGMVMKDAQMSFFVKSDCPQTQLIKINGESRMRTDMVRVGIDAADVRYRPEYPDWSAQINIEYNSGMISESQLKQIIAAAGYGCGLGEMRPEKGKFSFGRFEIGN